MNYLHLMKKVALLCVATACVASAQDSRFAFKGSAVSSGLSESQVLALVSDSTYLKAIAANRIVLKSVSDYFSVGRVLTAGQAGRGWLNIIGFGDTLITIVGDGNRTVGDSSAMMNAAGEWGFGTGPSAGFRLNVSGHVQANNFYAVSTIRIAGSTILSGTNPLLVGEQATTTAITPTSSGKVGIGTSGTGQLQGFLTVRPQTPTSDTMLVVRNDKNSTLDSTLIVHANADLQSASRAGFGVKTSGQARRAVLNVIGFGDTLVTIIGDGNRTFGDSSLAVLANGSLKSGTTYLQVASQYGIQTGSLLLENVSGLRGNDFSQQVDIMSTSGGIIISSGNSKNIRITPAAQLLIGASTKASQAYVTINANATADTTFMVRNDKNATLDSTVMSFANGSFYVGGNNLYLGGHRIRSNAAGDSLIFYDGNTMIFAILSDGSTADLVATTPFWKFFDKFRNEVLFWILAVAGILVCILALLSIYAKVRTIRFGGYETLVENS